MMTDMFAIPVQGGRAESAFVEFFMSKQAKSTGLGAINRESGRSQNEMESQGKTLKSYE